jgi:3-methylcrotonyl-CoA carboxylase beta subunit
VVDHLAENDEHALAILRDIVSHLGRRDARVARREAAARRCTIRGSLRVIPQDVRAPYDVREVIARLVDGSEFHEFKALFGTTLVCGFAHIWGMPVAILANNGVLFAKRARARISSNWPASAHPAAVPAEHLGLHGRRQV